MILSEDYYFMKRPSVFTVDFQKNLQTAPSIHNIYEFLCRSLEVLFRENFKHNTPEVKQILIRLTIFCIMLSQQGHCPFNISTWRPIILVGLILVLRTTDFEFVQVPPPTEIVKKYVFF
jgi:hypothetical protein